MSHPQFPARKRPQRPRGPAPSPRTASARGRVTRQPPGQGPCHCRAGPSGRPPLQEQPAACPVAMATTPSGHRWPTGRASVIRGALEEGGGAAVLAGAAKCVFIFVKSEIESISQGAPRLSESIRREEEAGLMSTRGRRPGPPGFSEARSSAPLESLRPPGVRRGPPG